VFHDGHQLQCVVTGGHNARQNAEGELSEAADFFFILGHTHVGFVDQGRLARVMGVAVFPPIRFRWKPDLGIEYKGVRVLNHPAGISRDPVAHAVRPVDPQPVEIAVFQFFRRQANLPNPVGAGFFEGKSFLFRPVGHVPDQVHGLRVWCPFAKYPDVITEVQTKKFVPACKVGQADFTAGEAVLRIFQTCQPALNRTGVMVSATDRFREVSACASQLASRRHQTLTGYGLGEVSRDAGFAARCSVGDSELRRH
jgi:hypothetical protein